MASLTPNNIQFFSSPEKFREWLDVNSTTCKEVWVGFYKTNTGKPSLTWSQSVDQALCYGWIDGIRKSLGDESYCIRFTPRNPKSIWSTVNIKKIEELTRLGLMKPAGTLLFEQRKEKNSGIYSFEQEAIEFTGEYLELFRKNEKAWNFFSSSANSYKKAATGWVLSAKQESTRKKRLETLISDSENNLRLAMMRR